MTAIPETFQYSTQGATPEFVLVVLAIASFIFVAIAFAHKLRSDDGSISTERVAFSLIGSILCFVTAYSSLVIDVLTGFQTHILHQPVILSILFVLLGIILFANFIYSLVAPEIIAPNTKQYSLGFDSKVRAEGEKGKKRDVDNDDDDEEEEE